ncbi:MAG: nucleotidyl transferase AbiEii/AbiGii toxin family protein [archaeon]
METEIDLKEEIIKLSNKTKFSPQGLEKDYHLTRILHKISEKRIKDLVFKGGTCLNKCYLGFYRLSEDLDFVYNQDVDNQSKGKIKKILNELRHKLFEILDELEFKTSKELGKGWKMLTSKEEPKIVGLEVITNYNSLINDSLQTIKLEISFRRKLMNSTKIKVIHHEFIDALGEPILKKNVEIEVIDLSENLAEKFRALVTRKNIAIRDIYDIHFILKNNILKIDKDIMKLILAKIKESKKEDFAKEDLIKFIDGLNSKLSDLNEKEIYSVLKSGEKVNVKDMVQVITLAFQRLGGFVR